MDQFTLLNTAATTAAATVLSEQDEFDSGVGGGGGGGGERGNECRVDNNYDGGKMELRIASIFVILVCSTLGACLPIFAAKQKDDSYIGLPAWSFFAAKFFGSGVIIATAFIHLLSPAEDALRNPCLTGGVMSEYDWVSGIMLITTFVLFCVELIAMRYSNNAVPLLPSPALGNGGSDQVNGRCLVGADAGQISSPKDDTGPDKTAVVGAVVQQDGDGRDCYYVDHRRRHSRNTSSMITHPNGSLDLQDPNAQFAAIFILEFGVIFHSVFIGLTLAVSGAEFVTLFIVMVFHQTFEGLALGSRLAVTPWPQSRRWTPYALALAFGLTTPIAIAVGLAFRHSYPPGSKTTLIVNGIFDSISAGILNYTGLVELMAREIMFSPEMRNAPLKTLLSALGLMALGAGLMALLGKWV